MLLDIVFTLAGFALLVWGADRFVSGAAGIAILLGVPPIIIGVTIVGFGTSAPEIMVSASAAAQGLTAMAVGNALGSNIANVGLVLGIAAIIRPITAELATMLRREILLLTVLTALTTLLFLDHQLSTLDIERGRLEPAREQRARNDKQRDQDTEVLRNDHEPTGNCSQPRPHSHLRMASLREPAPTHTRTSALTPRARGRQCPSRA